MTAASTPEEAPAVPFTVNQSQTNKLLFIGGRCRNFRAVGDNWIDIDFQAHQSTMVGSDDNGAGKSTMNVWLPYYVLTGKPYGEKEKVTALVNTINNKAMVCELVFSINGTCYKVIRGRKPDIFEIQYLHDGEFKLIKDDAGGKDWQDYLYSLLGLDKKNGPKILENVIILGKDKFKPFIEMGAEDRRTMVETIWDLGIFTDMNVNAKAERKRLNDERDEKGLEDHKHRQGVEKHTELMAAEHRSLDSMIETYNANHEGDVTQESTLEAQYKVASTAEADFTHIEDNFTQDCDQHKKDVDDAGANLTSEIVRLESDRDGAEAAHAEVEEDAKKNIVLIASTLDKGLALFAQTLSDDQKAAQASIEEWASQLELKRTQQTDLIDKLPELNEKLAEARVKVTEHKEAINACDSELLKYNGYYGRFGDKINDFQKRLDDYNAMGICPSCNREVDEDAKQGVADDIQPKIDQFKTQREELSARIAAQKEAKAVAEAAYTEANTLLATLQTELNDLTSQTQQVKFAIQTAERDLATAENKLVTLQSDYDAKVTQSKETADTKTKAEQKRIDDSLARKIQLVDGHDARVERAQQFYVNRLHSLDEKLSQARKRCDNDMSRAEKAVAEAADRALEALSSHRIRMQKAADYHQEQVDKHQAELDHMAKGLAEAAETTKRLDGEYNDLTAEIQDWDDILVLISDKEGKADIIRQYLPFLNAKINEYCESLGLFINFAMDDKFSVSMNAVDRKNQSLFSLSTGQRARVNLAILFALRDVANLKASVQTNLLVLDEVLENLSEQGALEATTMIKTKFPSSNLFVVTQRTSEFEEYFDNKVMYGLRDGFTTII
ncbi:SbcC-like subunit of palindrome specific endonucl ease [Vibrio phage K469]